MKKPKLVDIRTAVRMGKVNKVFRLYQKFTGEERGLNPIEEGCTSVILERVCTNSLRLNFIGKTMNISLPLYLYPYKTFVKEYKICQSIKNC